MRKFMTVIMAAALWATALTFAMADDPPAAHDCETSGTYHEKSQTIKWQCASTPQYLTCCGVVCDLQTRSNCCLPTERCMIDCTIQGSVSGGCKTFGE